jgi:hypothetical protein
MGRYFSCAAARSRGTGIHASSLAEWSRRTHRDPRVFEHPHAAGHSSHIVHAISSASARPTASGPSGDGESSLSFTFSRLCGPFAQRGRQRRAQWRRWNTRLDTDDRAIDRIARWVAERLTVPGVATAALEPRFNLSHESSQPDALRNGAHEGAALREWGNGRRVQVGGREAGKGQWAALA